MSTPGPRPAGRRQFLHAGALALLTLALGPARARAAAGGPRRLRLHSPHTGERIDATYFDGRALQADALAALDRFLRDFRTGDVHAIDPGVLDIAWSLARAADRPAGTFEIISGYRSRRTNERLRRTGGGGVASHSLHLEGKALDLRLAGLETSRLRDLALRLRRGGVGYYATDDFVHVDTGPVRRW